MKTLPSHYQLKIDANNYIEELIRENKYTFEEIAYKCSRKFGTGERQTKAMINRLLGLNMIRVEENNIIVWIAKDDDS